MNIITNIFLIVFHSVWILSLCDFFIWLIRSSCFNVLSCFTIFFVKCEVDFTYISNAVPAVEWEWTQFMTFR